MLTLPRFSYAAPDRFEDAVALGADPQARYLAGGTDLLPAMKHRLQTPATLVSLRRLSELRGVVESGGGLRIGAAVTLAELRAHPVVGARYPALAAAAASVATRTLQGTATLGGNVMLDTRCVFYNQPDGWRESIGGCLKCEGRVCHVAPAGDGCYAAHSADTVPPLWLYGARVELASPEGLRELPVSWLYDGADGRQWLRTRPGELLTRVILPAPTDPVVHHKIRLRGAVDFGAVLVAVQRRGAGGRAVISALGPAPIEVDGDSPEEVEEKAWVAARPLGTHLHNAAWRRQMVKVAVRRAFAACG